MVFLSPAEGGLFNAVQIILVENVFSFFLKFSSLSYLSLYSLTIDLCNPFLNQLKKRNQKFPFQENLLHRGNDKILCHLEFTTNYFVL